MQFEQVAEIVDGVPHTSRESGRVLYDFVVDTGRRHILELGFAHGVSACYMAAALDELGRGQVTTIDSQAAKARRPPIGELLQRTGLSEYVTPVWAQRSYTWELMRLIEQEARYDFVFIDGAHTWDVDGFAFFLSDRLLEPGGFMCFDDLDWTIASSPTLGQDPRMAALPEVERTTAQVGKVFDLLVRPHPSYRAWIEGSYGWARKAGRWKLWQRMPWADRLPRRRQTTAEQGAGPSRFAP